MEDIPYLFAGNLTAPEAIANARSGIDENEKL
jgi:hypothetical protein